MSNLNCVKAHIQNVGVNGFIELEAQEMLSNVSKFYTESYKSFIGQLNIFRTLKQEKTLLVDITEESILLYEGNPLTAVILYRFENEVIGNFIKRLFNQTRLLSLNVANRYNAIINPLILEPIMRAKYLKGEGLPLYHETSIRKKAKNERRLITAPEIELRNSFKAINRLLQHTYDKTNKNFQVGGKIGKSIRDNAEIHAENYFEFGVDIKNFFPSCKRDKVAKYTKFLFNECPKAEQRDWLHEQFLDVILKDDALFMGNPMSPVLANCILAPAVKYIKNMCDSFNMAFSVYFDDLTFSSDRFITEQFVNDMFDLAFKTYGLDKELELKNEKSEGFSGARRSVTGVKINHNNEVTCPRFMYQIIRKSIYHLDNGNPELVGFVDCTEKGSKVKAAPRKRFDSNEDRLDYVKHIVPFVISVDSTNKCRDYILRFKEKYLKYGIISRNYLAKLEAMAAEEKENNQ